jgi:hypothetical protein
MICIYTGPLLPPASLPLLAWLNPLTGGLFQPTGRTRLARGLLQDVLRRWHARCCPPA